MLDPHVVAMVGHMSHDTHVANGRRGPGVCVLAPTRATIQLNRDAFDRMTSACGARSDERRAALIGVTSRTISRAKGGKFGEGFIAQTLYTLGVVYGDFLSSRGLDPSFKHLFEVTVPDDAEPAAA